MVTKGIIKSIDLLGNTCTVHIPFFETAGNDPIIEVATVSNTPGSYNGYKVGDVVYVAFEDGNMSTPVIIGKLYLGTEKEKADPRGVSNVEESTAAKKATLPADSKLSADLDSNVPNTTVPYSSLSSIANGLNTLNTEVAQNNRDYGNQFKQVSSAITETGAELRSEIIQSADAIRAEVSKTTEDLEGKIKENTTNITATADAIKLEAKEREKAITGVTEEYTSVIEQTAKEISAKVVAKVDNGGELQDLGGGLTTKGLGWNIDNDQWTIKAYDQKADNSLPEGGLDLFKITRDSVTINAPNVKLAGYPSETTIKYIQVDATDEITDANKNSYDWGDVIPEWQDGKYIWQRTTIKKWEYVKKEKTTGYDDKTGQPITEMVETWEETVVSDKIVCLAGTSAVSFWLNCSTKLHTGDQQSEDIVIRALYKVGTGNEYPDTDATIYYRWVDGTNSDFTASSGGHVLTLTPDNIENNNLEVLAKRNDAEYARETIIFSPLNTPILILNKESGSLAYDSYGLTKINEEEVVTVESSVLLNTAEMENIPRKWNLTNCTAAKDANGDEILNASSLTITDINEAYDVATAECTATYIDSRGVDKTLSKIFTISKNKPGKSKYSIDIINDFVTVPAKEDGTITIDAETLKINSTHTVSGYYGDEVLTAIDYLSANSEVWESIAEDNTDFRIKYTTSAVTLITDGSIEAPNFALLGLTAPTGSILYELYRGPEKVAAGKFEISKLTQGVSATSYWVDYTARIHKGINQQDSITATAWSKFGNNPSVQNDSLWIRYGWRQEDGTFGDYCTPEKSTITVSVDDFLDADLIFELGTWDGTTFTGTDSEIITFSPLNTPVLDLSNDTGDLAYLADGTTKLGPPNTVSSTATIYLNGQIVTEGVSYTWNIPTGNTAEQTYVYDVVETDICIGSKIEVSELAATTNEFICTATINNPAIYKEPVILTKVFTVSKKIKGDNAVVYSLVMDQKSITLDPNIESSKNVTLSGTCYIHDGNQIQPYSGGEIQYRIDAQPDNDQDADDFIEIEATVVENGKFFFTAENITTQVEVQLVVDNIVVDKEVVKVINGGSNGISIVSQTTYYALINYNTDNNGFTAGWIKAPTGDADLEIKAYESYNSTTGIGTGEQNLSEGDQTVKNNWELQPPAHSTTTIQDGWKYWTTVRTETTATTNNISFSTPIINEEVSGAYALAQGKTTNYYQATDPNDGQNILKKGDCWFDTGSNLELVTQTMDPAVNENGTFDAKEQYVGYWVNTGSGENPNPQLVTKDNIDEIAITPGTTHAYKREQNCLKQWTGSAWEDIGGELVANKLTANYINALDITAKKVTVIDKNNSDILFDANGLGYDSNGNIVDPYVKIAGFTVKADSITSGKKTSLADNSSGVYIGTDGISIGSGFKVEAGEAGDTQVILSEDVSEQISAVSYWLSSSCTVHTGTKHNENIVVTAMKKVGNAGESPDAGAYLWWRYKTATKAGGEPSDWALAAAKYRINFTFPSEVPDDDILIIATHSDSSTFNPNAEDITIATDPRIYEREEIPFSPVNTPILNLTNDSASLAYNGNTKINDNDTVSSTAEIYFNRSKITSGVTYSWALSNCKNSSNSTSSTGATVTVKTLSANTATATCTATYNGQTYTKTFTITKQLKGDPGASGSPGSPGSPGSAGRSVLSTVKYYKLATSIPSAPSNSTGDPSGWSTSPPTFETGKNYYETTRTQYSTADASGNYYSWSTPVKNSMLTVDFIDSLGITAKKIQVTTGSGSSKKTLFKADGLAATPAVEIAGFTVNQSTLTAGTGTNYVQLGTEAIMLGGNSTTTAPFSVTKAGALTATSGKIAGFDISGDSITSVDNDKNLKLKSDGTIIAKGGEIGGFTIGNGGAGEPILFKRTDSSTLQDGSTLLGTTSGLAALTSPDHVVLWAGCANGLTPWEAVAAGKDYTLQTPFFVTSKGYMQSTSGKIGGFTIAGDSLASDYIKLKSNNLALIHDNAAIRLTTSTQEAVINPQGISATVGDFKLIAGEGGENPATLTLSNSGSIDITTNITVTFTINMDTGKNTVSVSTDSMYLPNKTTNLRIEASLSYYDYSDRPYSTGCKWDVDFTGPNQSYSTVLYSGLNTKNYLFWSWTLSIFTDNSPAYRPWADGGGQLYGIAIYAKDYKNYTNKTFTYRAEETQYRRTGAIKLSGSILPTDDDAALGSQYDYFNYGYFKNLVHTSCTSCSSDRKIKNNIEYDISKYDKVFDTLRPASYKYNDGTSDRTHLGFIAQDVQESISQAELTDKDYAIVVIDGDGFDKTLGKVVDEEKTSYYVRYGELHALEVRQIQLLKQEVKKLKAEIEELKSKQT